MFSLLTCYWMSTTVWHLSPFPDEIHAKHKPVRSSSEITLAPPVSLPSTAAHILLDLNHNSAGSLVNIPPVDQSLEHLNKDNILTIRKCGPADLIQLRDQFLALLHAVDADDDDARHGDAPDDEPNDGIVIQLGECWCCLTSR